MAIFFAFEEELSESYQFMETESESKLKKMKNQKKREAKHRHQKAMKSMDFNSLDSLQQKMIYEKIFQTLQVKDCIQYTVNPKEVQSNQHFISLNIDLVY